MKYFRYHNSKKLNINIEKINILSQIFQIIQKFQIPKISLFIITNVLDVLSIKYKISEIFLIFDMEVLGKEIF